MATNEILKLGFIILLHRFSLFHTSLGKKTIILEFFLFFESNSTNLITNQKLKFKKLVRLQLTTYCSSVSHCNHYTKVPVASGRHRKDFNCLQSCFTGSGFIRLIRRIS